MDRDMPNEIDESLDTYAAVGPIDDLYGHPAVTTVDASLLICMHCGYTTEHYEQLAHNDCDPEKNGIQTTWSEYIAENGFPKA